MRKKIFFLILFTVLLSACNNPDVKNVQNKSSNFRITDGTSKTYKNRAFEESEKNREADNKTSSERAQILSKTIVEMEGIEKAAVIISGNAAIIGITVTGSPTDKELIKFKKDVEEKVKLTDKNIKISAVTSDESLVERITELSARDTNKGEVSGFDMQNIIHQISPDTVTD